MEAVFCTKDIIRTLPSDPTVTAVQTCEKASAMVMQNSFLSSEIRVLLLYGGFIRGINVCENKVRVYCGSDLREIIGHVDAEALASGHDSDVLVEPLCLRGQPG